MTGQSKWTCDACGHTMVATQKGNHVHWQCPEQGQGKKKREAAERRAAGLDTPAEPKFFQYLACVCRCGTQIGQVKGQKKRQFVNHDHYDVWRRNALKKAAGGDVDLVEERKRAEEVAAVAAKDDAIRREAEAVHLLSPRASFLLWAKCLGFDPGDVSGIPA